jgi:ribonuclease HI
VPCFHNGGVLLSAALKGSTCRVMERIDAMSDSRPKVVMYTDGACHGNPGPGGYGVVILRDQQRKEISGGYRRTTNNRMELMAAIEGLRSLPERSDVVLYTDSRYLTDAINLGWVNGWKKRNWRKSTKEKVLNVDLWKALIQQLERHKVTIQWVEGHAGVRENERADRLSVQAAQKKGLPIDEGYENPEDHTAQPGLF